MLAAQQSFSAEYIRPSTKAASAYAGAGYRLPHHRHYIASYEDGLTTQPAWLEALSDNHFDDNYAGYSALLEIAEYYPLALHGVGLNLGGTDPLSTAYMAKLKRLVERVQPLRVSDHLCWTGIDSAKLHELMPLPYSEAVAGHVANRIDQVQQVLGCELLIENVSSYMQYQQSCMSEAEFLALVVDKAKCGLLLDVNNIYVSAINQGFSTEQYLQSIDGGRIRQFHLAGYSDEGTHLLDSHSAAVQAPVWRLFKDVLSRFGARPTLMEWDSELPEFEQLMAEISLITDCIAAEVAPVEQ